MRWWRGRGAPCRDSGLWRGHVQGMKCEVWAVCCMVECGLGIRAWSMVTACVWMCRGSVSRV